MTTNDIDPDADRTEALLRLRLHQLAEHAPTEVLRPDMIPIGADRPVARQPRRRTAAIAATIATLLGAAGVTTVALTAGGDGGAASPDAAVMQFVEAINSQDVLSAIDVVDPAEVDAVRAAFTDVASDAKRLQLLDSGFSLGGIDGIDLDVTDLSLTTDRLADDVAVVTATSGAISLSFDPAVFPLGSVIREAAGDGLKASRAVAELADSQPRVLVATVKRDGRWYVSISYTLAEFARHASDREVPPFDSVVAVGFDSPEAAASALYARLLIGDLTGAAATAAPGEGDAFARYASLWLPAAQRSADQATLDGLALALSDAAFDVSGDGDRRTATPRSFTITGTIPTSWVSNDQQVYDPDLPTMISTGTGSGFVLIPAGEPVPISIEGLPVLSFDQYTGEAANSTFARSDGSVAPLFAALDPSEGPLNVRIERAAGCTTFDAGAALWLSYLRLDGATTTADGGLTSCVTEPDLVSLLIASGVSNLPSVATIEISGQWYVSPLGTMTEQLVQLLRNVPDRAALFDSNVGFYLYGTSRPELEARLIDRPAAELTAPCAAITEANDGFVTRVVDQPSIAETRACQNDLWNQPFEVSTSSGDATSEPATTAPEE